MKRTTFAVSQTDELMKRISLLLSLLLSVLSAQTQPSAGGSPRSFKYNNLIQTFTGLTLTAPDKNLIAAEDEQTEKQGGFYTIGREIPANIDFLSTGSWLALPEGGKICRLQISADGAEALALNYSSFEIASGCELYIYDESRKQVLGAYNHNNNPSRDAFATELVQGNSLILEYYEPGKSTSASSIVISGVAYIYRASGFAAAKDFGDSEYCEVNINCSEGNNWQDEKKGVARILLKVGNSYGWCTGSLLNNVRQDCIPYFLTADHCGQGASASDLNQWIFYFNYEAAGCPVPSSQPSSNTITGCTFKASGGNGGNTGSDFYLVQLNTAPTFNPYFNGWSRSTTASTSGVSIHHPAGDIKKISTYTSTLVSSSWGSTPGTHWQVVWASTTNGHGVTEGGSSGSPIFNSAGQIIGDLTGGGSYCSTPNQPDLYGKFSYSWQSNGSTNSTRLKPWLDPDNTNPTTLNGYYCAGTLTANFSGTPTTVMVGGQVDFTDLSAGNPTSWTWSFPGGTPSSSSQQNPQNIQYNTAGVYNVTLTVSNGTTSDQEVKSAYINVITGGTAACDTLHYPFTGTPTLYQVQNGGYVSGNNSYGDLAKAEYFSSYSPFNQITGAWFWFGHAQNSGGNETVTFKVWNNSGSGGKPGTAIGQATLPLSTIAGHVSNNQMTYVSFSPPISIPGPFYVGLMLPQLSGNQLALVTNTDGDSSPSTGWEMFDDGNWYNYSESASWDLFISNAVFPQVCMQTVGMEETGDGLLLHIFPNPTSDHLNISISGETSDETVISIRDLSGKLLLKNIFIPEAGKPFRMNISSLTPGMYFLELRSKDRVFVRKFSVAR
jgi:lysyl endopeptidase